MKKINTYTFNNICYFLIFLSLIGCGNTLTYSGNQLEIFNANSTLLITKEFKLTKLQKVADFDKLPMEFEKYKYEINKFDFYLAQSPTQNSGLFNFITSMDKGLVKICLKKPDPFSVSLGVVTNPIALVKVPKNMPVNLLLNFCE